MSFLFETHYHTPNTSYCGHIGPKDALPKYRELGYRGVVVTDHYYKDWFEDKGNLSWKQKIDLWLAGYRAAAALAERNGLTVILGMELRFTDSWNDYLVYGIDEDFLTRNPELYHMTPAEFRRFSDENGLFFAQAHPFRSNCSPQDPACLHGVEIFNGNLRHDSRNEEAEAFARDHQLLALSGSDFHEWEDLGRGGMIFSKCPSDSKELAALLFSGGIEELRRPGRP